jgi:hypothetical protein
MFRSPLKNISPFLVLQASRKACSKKTIGGEKNPPKFNLTFTLGSTPYTIPCPGVVGWWTNLFISVSMHAREDGQETGFRFKDFVMSPKWPSSGKHFSQIWLQTRY